MGTIDLNTGVFTQLGNTGTLLAGIGTLNGNYYGGQWGGSTLYRSIRPTVDGGSRFCEESGGNSLFLKVKERTIANCWDKTEIPAKACGF